MHLGKYTLAYRLSLYTLSILVTLSQLDNSHASLSARPPPVWQLIARNKFVRADTGYPCWILSPC